ncbi:MAG: UMP kinase [Synergistales bacterium]|nr:UMP kinase [Synergistales bacterium]MDY6401093.1 UMP kinase [Synergistales bacterium]MDY6404686.1 UMP kinase [Synergistales bacterium]MDY6410898.1 UMP kinase [Synergistales bacterium]MDY6415131.1 UMP kinase [Synergistales bacterium]
MPKFKKILLKMSGEVLAGENHTGLDFKTVNNFAKNLAEIRNSGIELSIVVGGGNMIRGRDALDYGIERANIDSIGMLGTVMNALAIKAALENLKVPAQVLSAVGMPPIADLYNRERAKNLLSSGHVVIFAAGTGHPFFSTDTAAALRASELGLDCVVKATKVNGIYDKDPMKYNDAKFFPEVTYSDAIKLNLNVFDTAAFALCRENKIPIWVISIQDSDWVKNITEGANVGTIVRE